MPAFAGVDSVVHLAAEADVRTRWEGVLRANIIGTRNVLEAARRQGVPHVVFASSNHVIGMYEVDGAPEIYELHDGRVYDDTVAPRPDSLYGVSKGFGELLGRYYSDRHGLRVICLRIGGVTEEGRPPPGVPLEVDPARLDDEERRLRSRAIWLSHRDCAQLIRRAIDADGVRWAIAYGTSDNPRQMWNLTSARTLLGYEPEDSAPV